MNSLNWVDYVVLGVFFISTLAGLTRGMIKEIVSLISWIAAFFVAATFSKSLAAYFTNSDSVQSMVSSASTSMGVNATQSASMLAIGLSFIFLFVATIFVGTLLNFFMTRAIEGAGISFVNRILGAIFGLARGYLINLVMIFVVGLTPLAAQPWWTSSQFVVSFQPAVQWLGEIVQPGLKDLKEKMGQALKSINTESLQNGAQSIYQGFGGQ